MRLLASIKRGLRRQLIKAPFGMGRQLLFFANYRRFYDLSNPRTFNEKIQWRAAKDRRDWLVVASSKVASKEYVASKKSPYLLVPETYWHGANLAELKEQTPPGPWVLKASHRSGLVVFGEGPLRGADLPMDMHSWLRNTEWEFNRLWGYGQVRPEFILEERLPAVRGQVAPDDFKFFVFDGVVRMVQVDRGRGENHTRVLFDREWERLPYAFTRPQGQFGPPPSRLARRMTEVAEELGQGLDFVRVDLYLISEEVYFGELTVYPAAGFSHWPRALDKEVGGFWTLPTLGGDGR